MMASLCRALQSSHFSMKGKELNSGTAQEGEAALSFGWTLKHSPASHTRSCGLGWHFLVPVHTLSSQLGPFPPLFTS